MLPPPVTIGGSCSGQLVNKKCPQCWKESLPSLGRGSPAEQTGPDREEEEILWLPWQWQHGAMAGEQEIFTASLFL